MNARALFLVLVLTSVFPERASSQAAKQRNPTIGEVRVIGNRTLNRASIIAASGLEIGQALKPERIAEAKRRLLSVGNFGAGLENPEDGVSIKTVVDGELVTVLIIVVENELIRGIQITGSGPIPLSAILAIVEPMRNQVLNLPVLQRKVSEIRRLYEDRGYQGFVSEDMALKSGILHIPITVGKVGGIRIDGLDAEMYWFILSFLLTKPYDYYNVRHLAGDIAWLKAIGIDLQIHIPDGAGPEVEWIPVGGDLWFKVKPRIPKTAKSVEQHESIRNEPRITEIRVVGARQVTPESIIMASGLKIGDYLATDRFPDAARKVAALGAFGLRQRIPPYGVKIDSEEFRHKASVTIEVDENPVIRGFEIQNSGPIPGVEIIRLLDQHRGRMLTQSELQKSVGQIRQLYEDRGYQAFVTEKLEVRGDKLVVPIMVGVVKDVDITGIDYETAEYIHSMIENHAGAYYNINLLKRDLTWILNLGFENVNPSFTFQRPGEVGVTLQITAKPARG